MTKKNSATHLCGSHVKVGQTPKTAIWKKNKATVWFYPAKDKKYNTPLFLLYSLISKPYILDLSPQTSMIQALTRKGYNVYLLDFGVPGYEDKDITLDDYIEGYIKKAVQRTLTHSNSNEIALIGYCLGGTLATIYTAIADEHIKNLILFVTPIDFSKIPLTKSWRTFLIDEQKSIKTLIDYYGILPPTAIEKGIKFITTPVRITPYLALLENMEDEEFVDKWKRFNHWAKDHIPFVGSTLKQFLYDIVLENKLAKNSLEINGKPVNIKNIKANLLAISAKHDELVPEQCSSPIIDLVSSQNKVHKQVNGGHATIAMKGYLPEFFEEWLSIYSSDSYE